MRNAETVLGVIRERGKQALPLEDIYRQLYNPNLYLRAYARLYPNKGAMTPGTTTETVDGMSIVKIQHIIEQLRYERYRWTPVRRVHIPKPNGKTRPLGIPSWSDKLLQEVIRSILEAYYEPQFSDHSHGFRPARGCHTALDEIVTGWTGTRWFIEGDISRCFDSLDHSVLLTILREKLHDERFIRLIQQMLQAGYLEDWKYNETLSGSPQGGVVSPSLSNIYLDKLDKYVEQVLIPQYTRGETRRLYAPYWALKSKVANRRKAGRYEEAQALFKQMQQLPSYDPQDPDHRRLRYCRYADDFLLSFSGPKAEAEEIKGKLAEFLRDILKLELSQEKTLVTHASTQAARFLGYEIVNQQANSKHDQRGWRSLNGRIGLRIPADVVEKQCARYMRGGKIACRPELIHDADYSILVRYQAEYRGVVQYYLPALNVSWLWRLHWVMKTSLLKTLAAKYKSSVKKMARQYQATIDTPQGDSLKCLQVVVERVDKKPLVARFGGIHLQRQKKAVVEDRSPRLVRVAERNEIVKRFLADTCELCGSTQAVEVHHIRKLADLKKKGQKEKPLWVQMMAARHRKTLVVCRECHVSIHQGKAKI